jgi:hypothetical protein
MKNGVYLGFQQRSQKAMLAAVTHPVEARYLTGTRQANGERTPDTSSAEFGTSARGGNGLAANIAGAAASQICIGSRLTRCVSSMYSNVVIVVDGKAIDGLSSAQVADYIAVVALSHPESVDVCNSYPSILDLFAAGCGERASAKLTRSDVAFLKGLYSMDLESFANLQASSMAYEVKIDARGD